MKNFQHSLHFQAIGDVALGLSSERSNSKIPEIRKE